MGKFDFDGPPAGDGTGDLATECERQLRPLILQIVQSAEAAGWSRKDVLLAIVELAWDLYEGRRADQ